MNINMNINEPPIAGYNIQDPKPINAEKRLRVMMSISHPEEYYIQAISSKGVDYKALTHGQISAWVAALKTVEADILIEMANTMPLTDLRDVDMSVFENMR